MCRIQFPLALLCATAAAVSGHALSGHETSAFPAADAQAALIVFGLMVAALSVVSMAKFRACAGPKASAYDRLVEHEVTVNRVATDLWVVAHATLAGAAHRLVRIGPVMG